MRLDSRRLVRAKRAAFALCLIIPLLSFASDAHHAARVLWVSAERSVFQVSPVEGTPQLELASLPDVEALAVDQTTNHVWVYSHWHLAAYDTHGNVLANVHMPHEFHSDHAVAMAVDGKIGTVWIGTGHVLFRLDSRGHVQQKIRLGHSLAALTLDTRHSRVWIAERDRLLILDQNGEIVTHIDLPRHFSNRQPELLAYDVSLDQVWVKSGHEVTRYDQNGTEVFSASLPHDLDDFIAPDGQGNLWLAGDHTLAYLGQSGAVQFVLRPFDDKGHRHFHADGDDDLIDLVADPLNHTAWVANGRYLRQIGTDSSVLQTIDSESWLGDSDHDGDHKDDDHDHGHHFGWGWLWSWWGRDIHHVALYVDTIAPTISFTAPANESYTNQTKPILSLSVQDSGSGVDAGTIKVTTSDGVPIPVTCTTNQDDTGASCLPNTALADGYYTLSATVADYAGNISNSAFVTIIIDTVPPPLPGGASVGFIPGAPGSVTLVGQAGGVESDVAAVTVTNIRTGQSVTGNVNSDGSYSISIPGNSSDEFAITLTDLAGNVTAPFYLHGGDTALRLAITSPTVGTTFAGNLVNVTGIFQGALNTGITVNGKPAILSNGQWVANHVSLTPGTNTLTVTATTSGGLTLTRSETMTSSATTPLILTATPSGTGIAPFAATFQYQFLGTATPQSLKIDYTGSGNYVAVSDPTAPLSYTYSSPGIYPVTLRLTDANNVQYQAQLYVVVQDPSQMDSLFKSIWGDMTTALASGNKAAAMNALDYTAQQNYGSVFDALLPQMRQIAASCSPLMQSSVGSANAEYVVIRNQSGKRNAYFVDFIKDTDGVWRLDSM